ncbi:DeoR/GlpR family DNA-binding transcription regulator [Providencia heimbachae]|uniref:Galactitol utilization operon repressor n=1 Tax=Providencia heimbachae ATCC 35613 TaxID=1354272 RepID=A0A1B7JYC8_9GAMM|nr:DeoR/GlpR family DNA-binding transcription regulator [Providencia heimbachae]OAT52919.1 galactitol utilization operon repressor [Providencia heimbachae ATCC 35613]SQH14564.1 Lactose phosphotransferase system repressor [Providencia heimbachae]
MNTFERRNEIVDLINKNASMLVTELSDIFGISEVTIRTDLRLLEQKGLITRFHGGAAKVTNIINKDVQEIELAERYKIASDPKKRIAHAAIKMVTEGMTIILDSGSTTMLIAEAFASMSNITVITNNLPAAYVISENKDITLVVVGGTVRHKTHSMHGTIAELSLRGINADIMFVGADGIDMTNGITTFNEGYSISGVMADAANKVIAVLDSSKFNRRGFNQVLPLKKIDCMITDKHLAEIDKAALMQSHIDLILV